MVKKDTILIVEDNDLDRGFLKSILEDKYDIIEACDADSLTRALKDDLYGISLILLDLVMPDFNGMHTLRALQSYSATAVIPIIVTTTDDREETKIESYNSGAVGFVPKPFDSELLLNKIKSVLNFVNNTAHVSISKYDRLTGAFYKEYFYSVAKHFLSTHQNEEMDMICADVSRFKMINEKYGTDIGDSILYNISGSILSYIGENGVCGRVGPDIFAILTARMGYDEQQNFMDMIDRSNDSTGVQVSVNYGIYPISKYDIVVSTMCDRALLALRTIKSTYGVRYAVYDDTVRQEMLREQQILDCMDSAISQNQFTVYLQPKHNTVTGEVAGAEALARWIHPTLGFIAPNDFIPLFEKNGFIKKLDYFIWEKTCSIIRDWIDQGITPIPVSVNISRIDFESGDIIKDLDGLIDRYSLPKELLHLEITESAYAYDSERIVDVVSKLRDSGFLIEMDDFGSGYSSLDMLSEMPIDVLKLDMRLIRSQNRYSNKKAIMSFILSMSRWMGLKTIAEGVEDKDEVTFLGSIGCDYIQGFYFAKPMPYEKFKTYLSEHCLKETKTVETVSESGSGDGKDRDRILIVDDGAFNRKVIGDILSPDYDIVYACNGREAFGMMSKTKNGISLIMLDMMMPVMDGFQFLEEFQKTPYFGKIPVIAMSESGSKSESKALSLGAEDYVSKPVSGDVLSLRVSKALHHVKT